MLLFRKDKVSIDSDLLENSRKGLETRILMGEKIGCLSGDNYETGN